MQTIGSLWWVWLAGMLVSWGYVAFHQLRRRQSMRQSGLGRSSALSTGTGTSIPVGARYLGFVFLVFLGFATAVKLITGAAI